jgi:hypothetical protein
MTTARIYTVSVDTEIGINPEPKTFTDYREALAEYDQAVIYYDGMNAPEANVFVRDQDYTTYRACFGICLEDEDED